MTQTLGDDVKAFRVKLDGKVELEKYLESFRPLIRHRKTIE